MDRPVWPVVLFDSDGVPYGCLNEVVAAGYVEDTPEEFVSAFDSRGVQVRIVERGDDVVFVAGGAPREAEAIALLRSYALSSDLDPDELVGDGLRPAIRRLIDHDAAERFPRRVSRILRAWWSRKRRVRSRRSRRR